MKKLRIILLCHETLVPPSSVEGMSDAKVAPFKTEWDVYATLANLGHTVWPVGVGEDLGVIRRAVDTLHPDLAFNLLEEFAGVGVYDAHVAGYLEMLGLPYTGCNPRGLMLAHHKGLAKIIARHHRLPVPAFTTYPVTRAAVRRPRKLQFPLIVKSLTEEGSVGIAQASVVRTDEQLDERVRFVHRTLHTDAIAESYIDGREIYVGVLGNARLQTLPPWEVDFGTLRDDAPRIATGRIKWDDALPAVHQPHHRPPGRFTTLGSTRRCRASPAAPTGRCSSRATPGSTSALIRRASPGCSKPTLTPSSCTAKTSPNPPSMRASITRNSCRRSSTSASATA